MDDSQLREELTALGVNVGPINDTTRETYMRVLAKKKGAPSRSSTRKSHSPARVATPKTKTPPAKRNVSPPPIIERPVPISPPRRASPPPRRASPATRRASPPSRRRESPPPITRPSPQQERVSPRQYRQISPRRVSPPPLIRQPPPQPKRVSPRPFRQISSQYSRAGDSDNSFGRSTSAYNKIDFDNSVPDDEEDDDHMEFSKYIPRSSDHSYRQKNTSLTSSFLNSTKKKIAAVHPPKGFQFNSTFLAGVVFTVAVFAYILYPDKVHDGISSSSNYVNSAIMAGFKYAVMPFLILGVVFAIGLVVYYAFQAHTKNKAIYEEKKRKMIRDILKAVYNAPVNGIPVKQLRDRMIPAYKRTKDELLLWNECEDFVKTYETRVRAEERVNQKGDEVLLHFQWVASTDLEDD